MKGLLRRVTCALRGHADGAPFSADNGTLNVKCFECGRVSPGAVLPSTAPVVTQPGDSRRHRLGVRGLLRITARKDAA